MTWYPPLTWAASAHWSFSSWTLFPHPFSLHFHHGQCYFLPLCVKPVFLDGSSSRGGARRLVPLELHFTDLPDGCYFHPAFPENLFRCPHTTSFSVQQEHFGTLQSIHLHHVWHLAMEARNTARMLLHFFCASCSLIWHKIPFSLLTFT